MSTKPYCCKMVFQEFRQHFKKMTDEEIVSDIRQSCEALDDLTSNGSSWGDLCVMEATKQMEESSERNKKNIEARWKEQHKKPAPKPKCPPNVSPDGEVIESFVPPTIEQVQALCVEKRYPDPQGLAFRFFNFYSPDWKTGKGKRAKPMDSWPMALAGWVSRDNGVFRVPEFADIQKYLTENCAKAGLDVDFVATQFLNKGTKEGWKGIRNWEAMLKQYVNTIVCSQSKGAK